ncbi:hypothetical protein PCE1_004063 [Barthelona sp. PCE]
MSLKTGQKSRSHGYKTASQTQNTQRHAYYNKTLPAANTIIANQQNPLPSDPGMISKSRTKSSLGLERKISRSQHDQYALFGEADKNGYYIHAPSEVIAERYRCIDAIGSGTFSTVVKAEDLRTNTFVALKIIRSPLKYRDAAKYEIRCLNKFNKGKNQKIIELLDHFDWRGHVVMVFPLFKGDLFKLITEKRLIRVNLEDIREVARNMIEAIQALSSEGYIHTDIKPENILLTQKHSNGGSTPNIEKQEEDFENEGGPAKWILSDLGSAVHSTQKPPSIICTRQFRPPEAILQLKYDFKVDIWSLGCVLFELYTGDMMFPTHSNHEHLAMIEHLIGPIPTAMVEEAPDAIRQKYFSGRPLHLIWPPTNRMGPNKQPEIDVKTHRRSQSNDKYKTIENVVSVMERVKSMKTMEERVPDPDFRDFLFRMLAIDPCIRNTPENLLNHPFLSPKEEVRQEDAVSTSPMNVETKLDAN